MQSRLLPAHLLLEPQLHDWSLDLVAGSHEQLSQTRNTQSEVDASVACQMESVESHLSGGLADGLGSCAADTLARLDHAVEVLEPIHFLELAVVGWLVDEVVALLGHGAQVGGGLEFLQDGLVGGKIRQILLGLEFLYLLGLHQALQVRVLEFGLVGLEVLGQEVELAEELLLRGVQRVLPIQELHDAPIAVPHGVVVLDLQRLQVLHQAALKVSTAGSFDGRINESLSACHAVEIEVLFSKSGEEAVGDEPRGAGVRVVRHERREGLARDHHGHSSSLELLLAEHDAHLGVVDIGALGPRDCHHAEVVAGEHLDKALHAGVDDLGGLLVQVVLVLGVELLQGVLLGDNFALQVVQDLLSLHHVGPGLLLDHIALLIALVGAASKVVHVGWGFAAERFANFLHRLLVGLVQHLMPLLVHFVLQHQVIQPASEPMHLNVAQEQLGEACDQLASGGLPVELVEGVEHAVLGPTSHLVLVNDAAQQLVVLNQDVGFLFVSLQVAFGYFSTRLHAQSLLTLETDFRQLHHHLYHIGNQLLAGPQLTREQDGRLHQRHPGVLGLLVQEGEGGLVEQFGEVLFVKEGVLHGHVDGRDDGVLDDFAQGLPVGRVVVHLVANAQLGLCLRHVVLEGVEVHFIPVEVSVVRLAVGIVHPEGGLLGQHLDAMRHESRLVQGGLAVEHHVVPVDEVAVDHFVLVVDEEVAGVGEALLVVEELQLDEAAVFLQEVRAGVVLPVDHVRLQLLQVVLVDGLGESQLLRHEDRQPHFVRVEAGVR